MGLKEMNKKKNLIVSLFAAIMITVPFTVVGTEPIGLDINSEKDAEENDYNSGELKICADCDGWLERLEELAHLMVDRETFFKYLREYLTLAIKYILLCV